jgi:hypothetical protein
MAALVMYQTDTPGDKGGIFSSAQIAEAYRNFVDSGKIITIANHTRGERRYQTPPSTATRARYSVVKILDGDYAGRGVLVQDKYLLK